MAYVYMPFFLLVVRSFTSRNIGSFFVEPRRHKGTLTWGKRKKVVVVCDEPHVAKWREMWHNSKVRQKVLLLVDGNNSVSLALMREELTRHNSKVRSR